MFLNRCYEPEATNMDSSMNQANVMPQVGMPGMAGMGCCPSNMCPPVMECPQERVCHRQMCYEVPHIIPVNTRIINHHIYRHTYQPVFTCTMEDEVSNVYDNHCGM